MYANVSCSCSCVRDLNDATSLSLRIVDETCLSSLPNPKKLSRDEFVQNLLQARTPTAQRETILEFEAAAAPSSRLNEVPK